MTSLKSNGKTQLLISCIRNHFFYSKFCKLISIIGVFIYFLSILPAQIPLTLKDTQNVRALVIGISDYKHIQDLQFADKDAKAIHEFLVANNVSSIKGGHTTLLLNNNATSAKVYSELDRLVEESKAGDWVYIFFSGHGDIEKKTSIKRGFLLCYDVLPAAYHQGGTLAINYFQDYIQTISEKGIKVILFVDACRSGALAGGASGINNTNKALQGSWSNELKILSSQPGELSLESKKQKHGIFSYYLVKGLYGIADHNQNHEISLVELLSFLINQIPRETENNQTPIVSGDMQAVISYVDTTFDNSQAPNPKPALAEKNEGLIKRRQNSFSNSLKNKSKEKSTGDIQKKYQQFLKFIQSEILVPPPDDSCALDIYHELLNNSDPKAKKIVIEMRRTLNAKLQEKIQDAFGVYFYKMEGFIEEVNPGQMELYASTVMDLLGKKHILYSDFEANRLFFKSFRIDDYDQRKTVLDSAIHLDAEKPFIKYELARILHAQEEYKKAASLFDEVKEMSPTWRYINPFNLYTNVCNGNCDNGKGTYFYPNGDKYKGEWKDFKRHGTGVYKLASGDEYDGEWENDEMQGKGKYTYDNGDVYSGDFKRGRIDGDGEYRFSNGSIYKGEWANDQQNGKGLLSYPNGTEISGIWTNGQVNGKAKYFYPNGDYYVGSFVNNKRNGFGKMISERGEVYEGEWKMGRKDGIGKMTFASGVIYEGDWKQGKMTGEGNLTTPAGSEYAGTFRNGRYNGNGKLRHSNGDIYEGEWLNGKKNGIGKYEYSDGSRYIGEWYMDNRHGHGTYIYADGTTTYEGQFHSGRVHGIGTKTKANGEVQTGKFLYGKYAGAADDNNKNN